MIFIDRTGFGPDADWMERVVIVNQQLRSTSDTTEIFRIIDANQSLWGELKESLLKLSNYKCWYSESKEKYSHLHVDHFRPKKVAIGKDNKTDFGGYWWLAFDWTNYRVCGSVGNVNKRDKFAVLRNKANVPTDIWRDEVIYFLDPCEEEDPLKLTFNSNGEMMPIQKTGWDFEQADYTIEKLKLNCKSLKEARKKVWIKCAGLVGDTQRLMQENNLNPSPFKKGQIKEKLIQIKELVKSSSEFTATARACLKSTGIDWAISIAA
jgi:uncharacterized protein (TIGR02646 family)